MTAPSATAAPGKVLVVDDDELMREACRLALRRDGWTVTEAADGNAALAEIAARDRFDCVVSDVQMPGLDGFQLLAAIRERDDDVPVLMMTGAPTLSGAMAAMSTGAVLYLPKPFAPDELRAAVARAARASSVARMQKRARTVSSGEDRSATTARFDEAIAKMWMAFQPIVDRMGATVAFEALLRTDEPTLVRPDRFLATAERLGRVQQVGRAVRAAVALAAPQAPPDALLFVNLHGHELNDEELYSPSAPLSQCASRVVLEITERVGLDGVPDAASRIATLRKRGFRIAVDDLGAGYAGLGSLVALEPEVVKLDIALVRGAAEHALKRRVVSSIATLCRELGCRVVAEGIETVDDRTAMLEAGVELLQGYLFGRPARAFAR